MTFTASALRIAAGAIIWALHFAAIYGLTALACARDTTAFVPWIVASSTALAVAALVVVIAAGVRRRAEFEPWLAVAIASVALLAIVWEATTVLLLVGPPCA